MAGPTFSIGPDFDISKFKNGCTLIPREDLFNLISGSHKPEAKILQEWVNHHILPTLQDIHGKSEVAALESKPQEALAA
jgi:prophage antirepressor-like protein